MNVTTRRNSMKGDDKDCEQLVKELKPKEVDTLFEMPEVQQRIRKGKSNG